MKTKNDTRLDGVILDAQKELQELRDEVDKYKIIFDSARLIVGHEFIKPLTSINGYIEALENVLEGKMGEKECRYFEKVREAVARLEELVDAFVQLIRFDSRIEQVIDLERVDVTSLVDRVRARFGERASSIVNAVDCGLPLLLLRRKGFELVLENLISNAIKHGGSSKPVMVTGSLQQERRGTSKEKLLIISVEDQGDGIPEEELDKIFNPFYRMGGVVDAPGLGLGLALVKSIVTIMKGKIHIKSKQGQGTTVTITVPVSQEEHVLSESVG